MVTLIASVTSCNQNTAGTNKPLNTEIDSLSYGLGVQVASNIGSTFEGLDKEQVWPQNEKGGRFLFW